MQHLLIGLTAAASLLGAAQASAQAGQGGQLVLGVDRPADRPLLTPAQFVYGGRQYCWYPNGWKGPGFYWCGYAMRRGYGWGGPAGWMGYTYRGGSYYHGGVVYRGGTAYRGGAVSGSQSYVRGPNGGVAHGGQVHGAYGGSARGGSAYGPHGGSAHGGAVTGPGGHTAAGARVTGPNGQTRTVHGHN
jgi:hypothetical protein